MRFLRKKDRTSLYAGRNECSPPARGGRLAAALAMFFKTLRICNDEDNLLGGRRRCFKAPGGAPKVRGAVRAVCEIWQY